MKTTAVIFPFDLFGSGGTGAGADLLGDELDEILADNRRESVPTRARAYNKHVQIQRFTFETPAACAAWRADGRKAARQVLRRGDFLLWIAGNHLGALPVYDELAAAADTLVVQFDAHLDIHQFDDCTKELSHGNFLLHGAGTLPRLINVGHRELLLTENDVAKSFARTFAASNLAVDEAKVCDELASVAAGATRLFLDIDCDVFDPAYFPAVSQPVPFGIAPRQLLRLIEAVGASELAGVMISEFDPGRDRDDRSLATLVWLIEYLLLRKYE
jgi:arginase family enzyme